MKKTILFFISILGMFLCASFVFADYNGNVGGLTNFGSTYSPERNIVTIYGGGTNAASDVSGTHTTGLEAPGTICLESYKSDGITRILNCLWFDNSGILRYSSGLINESGSSVGDSDTGYGLPTDSGFDYESSGAVIGSQS